LRWAKSRRSEAARRRDEGRFRSLVEQLPCVTYEREFDVQAILLKPGRLTPAEFDKVKEHTLIGAEMLAGGGISAARARGADCSHAPRALGRHGLPVWARRH
jgi:hypothetical protein